MADTINTIIPWILLVIAAIWIFSVFGEPIKRFYEWIKGFTRSGRERFQPRDPRTMVQEFTYS